MQQEREMIKEWNQKNRRRNGGRKGEICNEKKGK